MVSGVDFWGHNVYGVCLETRGKSKKNYKRLKNDKIKDVSVCPLRWMPGKTGSFFPGPVGGCLPGGAGRPGHRYLPCIPGIQRTPGHGSGPPNSRWTPHWEPSFRRCLKLS